MAAILKIDLYSKLERLEAEPTMRQRKLDFRKKQENTEFK
jgi:hypothetical protein